MIESNGVSATYEIEKCSELAASLELYHPGADLRLQQLKDEKNPKFQEKFAPVIAGLKQSQKIKIKLQSLEIQENIEQAVLRMEAQTLDEAVRKLFGEADLLMLNKTLGGSIETLLALVPFKEDRTDQIESSTST